VPKQITQKPKKLWARVLGAGNNRGHRSRLRAENKRKSSEVIKARNPWAANGTTKSSRGNQLQIESWRTCETKQQTGKSLHKNEDCENQIATERKRRPKKRLDLRKAHEEK
jgi:hypothetical protein